jgi:hypothetical protein
MVARKAVPERIFAWRMLMLQTTWATVQSGQIRLAEDIKLPEGTKLLVTILREDEDQFWLGASQTSLAGVWNNAEDDAYAQLLKE